jgi:hypothetical protein
MEASDEPSRSDQENIAIVVPPISERSCGEPSTAINANDPRLTVEPEVARFEKDGQPSQM